MQADRKPAEPVAVYIDYDEFKPETYRAAVVMTGEVEARFATGNPARDLRHAERYASDLAAVTRTQVIILSKVDHFIADMKRRHEASRG